VHGAVAKITEARQNYRELTALKEASKAIRTPFAIFRGQVIARACMIF